MSAEKADETAVQVGRDCSDCNIASVKVTASGGNSEAQRTKHGKCKVPHYEEVQASS